MGIRNPVLDLRLVDVMRPEIARSLECTLRVYTVGNLIRAWGWPKNQRVIETIFDTPLQARQALRTCATWIGVDKCPASQEYTCWWKKEESPLHA